MKKIITSIIILTTLSFSINAQENETFTFVKSSIIKLEKQAKYNDYGVNVNFNPTFLQKRMTGMYLLKDTIQTIDYETGKYIPLSSIPITEKFKTITAINSNENEWENNVIIQNIKTKQLYAIMFFPIRVFQDYSNMGNEANGYGWLTKAVPRELTKEEQLLISKYKALIKSANANITILLSIQKKYLTRRGYFDPSRVNTVDKKIYNANIINLKNNAEKLSDIDRYEDKNNIAQDRLTTSELGSLMNINEWSNNQTKIN